MLVNMFKNIQLKKQQNNVLYNYSLKTVITISLKTKLQKISPHIEESL
jgi:hypothetical protein